MSSTIRFEMAAAQTQRAANLFRLNSALDVHQLHRAFQRSRCLLIPQVLPLLAARYLYDILTDDREHIHATEREALNAESTSDRPNGSLQACWAKFGMFVNSPDFLDFVRTITGVARIRSAVVSPVRYQPGQSYKLQQPNVPYLVLAIFNLTPDWKQHWGGLLEFLGPDGGIGETFVPRFNSLSLFSVTLRPSISFLAPFAACAQYSVQAYLADDDHQ